MERAKKMVLISAENLERMRHLQSQVSSETGDNNEMKRNTTIPSVENENSGRTPGTPLSRLDAEMKRILDSAIPIEERERWKMYKEVLWRYLHFVRETKRKRVLESNNDTRNGNDDDDHDDDEDADDIDETGSVADGATRKSVCFAKEADTENVKRILDSVPKTYHGKARSLMKHLLGAAIPSRIRWNADGLITIDDTIVTGSNITELVNDAMREKKTMEAAGRLQFARLLREINTPSDLIGNRELRITPTRTPNIKRPLPRASSTPKTPLAHSPLSTTEEREMLTQYLSANEGDETLIAETDSPTRTKKGQLQRV